jgi:polar amino acid transport system substrate-binding protein
MYYNTPSMVIGPKGGDKNIAPEALKGKTIGSQASTTHANYVEKYFVPAGATSKTYKGQDEANADLAAGRIDYVQADSITLFNFLASDEGKACCEAYGMVPHDDAVLGPGVGVGLRKEDTALKDKINAAIHALGKKGVYDQLAEKHGLAGKLATPKE